MFTLKRGPDGQAIGASLGTHNIRQMRGMATASDFHTILFAYEIRYAIKCCLFYVHLINDPNNKVHGANVEPIRGRQGPGGPHVGPMNFVIWWINQ